jgi:hypothetical protein
MNTSKENLKWNKEGNPNSGQEGQPDYIFVVRTIDKNEIVKPFETGTDCENFIEYGLIL